MQIAKQLADCVIPNEYGIDAGSKMRIGSKICCALLGKLLADLSNMQEESIATAVGLHYFFVDSKSWLVARAHDA